MPSWLEGICSPSSDGEDDSSEGDGSTDEFSSSDSETDAPLKSRGDETDPESGVSDSETKQIRAGEDILTYRADIDGLRAFAVIPVVLFHFELGFPGGFAGVDVFFVISGYLITHILLSDVGSSKPMWWFWVRRARRLFPALVVVLSFLLVMGWQVLLAATYSSLAGQVVAVLFLVANFHLYHMTGYFFSPLEAPLLHCWSLAVEEQFYVIYPCLLYVLQKLGAGRGALFGVLSLIFVWSLLASIVLTPSHENLAFYLLPTRAWELVLGGMLAFGQNGPVLDHHRILAEVSSWIGVGMIAVSYFAYSAHTPYPGYCALLPCCGSALFIASQHGRRTVCGQIFASECFVFIGKISYSLYLWHWPVFFFLAYKSVDNKVETYQAVLGIALSVGAAAASYFLVEQPFRSESKVPHRVFLALTVCTWLSLLLCSLYVQSTGVGGIHGKLAQVTAGSWSHGKRAQVCSRNATFSNSGEGCLVYLNRSELDEAYSVHPSRIQASAIAASLGWSYRQDRFQVKGPAEPPVVGPPLTGTQKPLIAAIGSSHCCMYGWSLDQLANEYGTQIGVLCRNGVPGVFHRPLNEWDTRRLSYLDNWQVELIIWFEIWGQWAVSMEELTYNFKLVTERAERVIIFGDTPAVPITFNQWGNDLLKKDVMRRSETQGFSYLSNLREHQGGVFGQHRRLEAEANISHLCSSDAFRGRMQFFQVAPFFVDEASQHLQLVDPCKGTLIYKDYGHLNDDGAKRVEQLFRTHIFGQVICD